MSNEIILINNNLNNLINSKIYNKLSGKYILLFLIVYNEINKFINYSNILFRFY